MLRKYGSNQTFPAKRRSHKYYNQRLWKEMFFVLFLIVKLTCVHRLFEKVHKTVKK